MTMVAVVAPAIIVVVVVPAWPHVTATVVASTPPVEVLPLRVRHAVVPVEDTASLVVCRSPNPPRLLQEGEVLHHLQMVAQNVDLTPLDVDRLVVVWMFLSGSVTVSWTSVGMSHGSQHQAQRSKDLVRWRLRVVSSR